MRGCPPTGKQSRKICPLSRVVTGPVSESSLGMTLRKKYPSTVKFGTMKTSGMVNESSAARSPGSSFQKPQATSPKRPESRSRSVKPRVGMLEVALTLEPWAKTSSALSFFGANGAFTIRDMVKICGPAVKPVHADWP